MNNERNMIREEEKSIIMIKKLFSLLCVALLAMAVLGGCSSDGTGESSGNNSSNDLSGSEPTYGGSVVVGIQQDIDSLDPHKAASAGTKEILFNIFEGLVKPDENGDLIGAVASDYKVSEDGLVYTFTLRDNVKFHNGSVVTADDVKYSLERVSGLLDGTALISTLSSAKGGIQKVDILDEKTVQVTVGSANMELIYSFVAAIIPKGSGDTALLELQGGTIDIYAYLTDSQAQVLEQTNAFELAASPSNVVQALFLNNAVKPLDNVKVRQAIAYALDKEEIDDFVGGGTGALISSAMLPTLTTYYVDLNDTYGNTANVEKAKELLKEAGYPDGFDLTITIPSNYEFHMQTGQVVVEQLKAAGINATIQAVDWNTWYDDAYVGRKYTATISGITCDLTPGYLLNRFQSDSKKNFINYANAQYDEIYKKAQSSLDLNEKADYYKQLQKLLCDEAGTAFIQVPANKTAISKELAGYKFYPVYVQDMSTVFYVGK